MKHRMLTSTPRIATRARDIQARAKGIRACARGIQACAVGIAACALAFSACENSSAPAIGTVSSALKVETLTGNERRGEVREMRDSPDTTPSSATATGFIQNCGYDGGGYEASVFRAEAQHAVKMHLLSLYETVPGRTWDEKSERVVDANGMPIADKQEPMASVTGRGTIRVTEPGEHVIFLATYEGAEWRVSVEKGASLKELHLFSHGESSVSVPDGTKVVQHSHADFYGSASAGKAMADKELASGAQDGDDPNHENRVISPYGTFPEDRNTCTATDYHAAVEAEQNSLDPATFGDHSPENLRRMDQVHRNIMRITNSCETAGLIAAAERMTGLTMSTFDSCYIGNDIVIDDSTVIRPPAAKSKEKAKDDLK